MYPTVSLNQGQFCPSGDFWQCLETILVVTPGWGDATCTWRVEVRGAAKHPTMRSTASLPKYQAEISLEPKLSDPRVEIEETCGGAKGTVRGVRGPGIQPLL